MAMKSPSTLRLIRSIEDQGVKLMQLPTCPKCGCSVSEKSWDAHAANCSGPGGVKAWRLPIAA